MKNTHTTHTHKALGFVVESIREIRKDVTKGERVFADEKLYNLSRTVRSIQRDQLPMDLEDARSQSDDDQLQESISDARTTIGTFFDDLRSITNETYGSVRDQLQAGEGNLKP
jgi:hypothetical protein